MSAALENPRAGEASAAWEPVIGLEVHAQLRTRTKIFCGCSAAYGAPPNRHVCPVCLGHPGVLPVLNRKVVELAMRAALAMGCEVHAASRFARKNYFYPDLPKGYQISQYDAPLATGGGLDVGPLETARRVRLVRIHLEEDAGKIIHDGAWSLVDFNRAGVPLIEIVSEPDIRTAEDASEYLKELRLLLRSLGVCDGNMEEGSLRCDANVSVRRRGEEKLGTRAELKNLNSFKYVKDAIEHEVQRQVALLESGERVVQETRQYDPGTGRTAPMRSKEEAHDYRYFPDPDLPPLRVDAQWIEAVRVSLRETPRARRTRYVKTLGLSDYDAAVLVSEEGLGEFFEAVLKVHDDAKSAANFLMSEMLKELKEVGGDIDRCRTAPREVGALLEMVRKGEIARATAKDVFVKMFREGVGAAEYVKARGLGQVSDYDALRTLSGSLVAQNADKAAEYHGGKEKLFGFFMGLVMKATGGKASPELAKKALQDALDEKKPPTP
ncbi:MAG TPA: Asp-tRNA(Asn)/Glu-tRNA(Gln) amidotransferase subunit GatB [Myxococcota bacterium]|nr:Asp-tRNA(Asn)/Glu-tRNA(Gln) amidotransferase subunit GatB [Myxococcota bacterium]